MPAPRKPVREPLRLEASLSGILALLVEHRDANPPTSAKTELLLSDAGLTNDEIAGLTGKNAEAIRKSLERARKPKPPSTTRGNANE